MTVRDDLKEKPQAFDMFRVMRELERSDPHKPRISDSATIAEDVASMAQDPFMEFPAVNISDYEEKKGRPPRLATRFLGFFGPQGALPLTTTVEAETWSRSGDKSFVEFTNVFSNRFLQLFFRAWSDSKAITQADRPRDDRFSTYLGSFAGLGSPAFANRDTIEDISKLPRAGLVASRIKSVRRLRSLIRGLFGADVEISERVGTWLTFEPGDRMALGATGSSLGVDTYVGERVFSINEKISIAIRLSSLAEYEQYLPGSAMHEKLVDAIFFYLGHRFEFDIQLGLPAHEAPPVKLGETGRLGWTSWVAPPDAADTQPRYLMDARISPMEPRIAEEMERAGAT